MQRNRQALGNRHATAADAGGRSGVLADPVEDLPFTVVDKVMRTPRIVELRLAPLENPVRWQPGQYVLLSDLHGDVGPRSYSVAGSHQPDGDIVLLITAVPGGETSTWAHGLPLGATVLLGGPYGTFLDDPEFSGPVLHIAAGSGLAPILPIADAQLRAAAARPVTILFSARTPADLYMLERFAHWERVHRAFRYVRTLTRSGGAPPHGRVPATLPAMFPDLSDHAVFIAGNDGFVDACAAAVRACGARPDRIRTEAFFTEPRPWSNQPTTRPHHLGTPA